MYLYAKFHSDSEKEKKKEDVGDFRTALSLVFLFLRALSMGFICHGRLTIIDVETYS